MLSYLTTIIFILAINHGASKIYLSLRSSFTDSAFKLTEGAINTVFTEHNLQKFVIPGDCLQICELFGEGKTKL